MLWFFACFFFTCTAWTRVFAVCRRARWALGTERWTQSWDLAAAVRAADVLSVTVGLRKGIWGWWGACMQVGVMT